MYGTQAEEPIKEQKQEFENDVKMYGTQAIFMTDAKEERLRMM